MVLFLVSQNVKLVRSTFSPSLFNCVVNASLKSDILPDFCTYTEHFDVTPVLGWRRTAVKNMNKS